LKLSVFIACFALLGFQDISAQLFQINPYIGHTLPMPLKTYYGRFITDGGPNYGINIGWGNGINAGGISQNAFFELQYNYSKSPLEYDSYYSSDRYQLGDLTMHNILAGISKGSGNGTFEGYGGYHLGVTIMDIEDPEAFDYTRFTMAFSAGLKYYVTPGLGIRLQTQLYLPFWSSSLYLGWYGGASGTISALCSPYMNFNVGIFANIDRSY